MSTILFECDVTEFEADKNKMLSKNNINVFALNEKCLIVNFMDNDRLLMQSEIERKDAIQLAKLILMKYT